jgi:hypothetical protein
MDITSKYIKMCEGSKKYINKKEEIWDWYYDKESETLEVIGSLNTAHSMGNNYHKDEIPLYRQDQLQEMILDNSDPYNLAMAFGTWIDPTYGYKGEDKVKRAHYVMSFDSIDQLWLAFVMHEKYGKMWDNEKDEWLDID